VKVSLFTSKKTGYDTITVAKENGKAVIMLSNPEALNIFGQKTVSELQSAVNSINADRDIQVVIIGAEGARAFSAGGNIKEELYMSDSDAAEWSKSGQELMSSIEDSGKIYIAALHGYTIGAGCELACACDFRIGADNLKISAPAIKIGMICGFGGGVRLPRIIGVSKAKELLILGHTMDAKEAYRVGFLNRVTVSDELWNTVNMFADELLKLSPRSTELAKKVIYHTLNNPVKESAKNETELFAQMAKYEDRLEGLRAFIEKRTPDFKGC
jgi:enoyl-CoA hydratase